MNIIKKFETLIISLIVLIIITTIAIFIIPSKSEREYNTKKWEYKTKQLELNYLQQLEYTQNIYEVRKTLHYIDSIKTKHSN